MLGFCCKKKRIKYILTHYFAFFIIVLIKMILVKAYRPRNTFYNKIKNKFDLEIDIGF